MHLAPDERRTADLVQHDQERQLAPPAFEASQQALGNDPGLMMDCLFGQTHADHFGGVVHLDHRLLVVHVDHAHIVDGLVERAGAVAHAVAAERSD
ncbi:hypothetical protein D3C79_892780 [compost metagenome]